ncbi:MAG: anthranilate/aminodeoxychorismate synthase component II [Phycisphaerae bacterium]|nr:anthranilate/aminodeoxychorismate synthase component II [Phycisphaerae bacterium]HAW94859.1 anthranilate/aminodeoxychorismate synthase component II [Phycisphaerales bacterium]
MILLIDNYDSFTWNLVQRIGELDASIPVRVVRNDEIDADEAERLSPSHLIISPGPCTPDETGACKSILDRLSGQVPILGVCLGHQTIGALSGMLVERATVPVHGKTSAVHHDGRGIFAGLSQPFEATRYHSLIVNRDSVDTTRFEISAWLEDGTIMGLRAMQTEQPVDGVQFHPESFLTAEGPRLLANFLGLDRAARIL